MHTSRLPKRKDDTKKLITAWVSEKDLEILKENNLNVSEIVRDAVKKAARAALRLK